MTELYNYEKLGVPSKRGSKYYFYRNSGLQNQSVLYQQDTLESTPRVFFDVNELSEDGTTAISTASFSESGEYWAVGMSKKGSDWVEITIKVVNPENPRASELKERLEWVKFSSIQWTFDDAGFFYARYPKPATLAEGQSAGSETEANLNHSIYYHRIGTPQEEDWLVCRSVENPKWTFGTWVSDDKGEYVTIMASEGAAPENQLWFARTADVLKQAELHHKHPDQHPEPLC